MRIIAGAFKGRQIRTTEGPGYRPATGRVRESVFSMLESLGVEWRGTRAADVFAGSGSLGLESLSRGAQEVVFVEKAAQASALIRENLDGLGVDRTRWRVVKADALSWAKSAAVDQFDLIFVDPPYGKGLLVPVVRQLVARDVLSRDGLVCAEVEAGLAFENPPHPDLITVRDKLYGQTRICIWGRE